MDKILAAACLRDSHLLQRFLRYVVGHTLAGERGQLKEYSVAVDVFERDASFDPRVDPVVRMAARRLRQKLQEYYARDGVQDALRIEIPKGGYSAVFHAMPPILPSSANAVASTGSPARGEPPVWQDQPPVYKVCIGGIERCRRHGHRLLGTRTAHERSARGPEKIVLAVMPFANLGGDSQRDYFPMESLRSL